MLLLEQLSHVPAVDNRDVVAVLPKLQLHTNGR
jgi:hypothetical protein